MHTLTGTLARPLPAKRHYLRSATCGWVALAVMIAAGSTTPSFGKQLTETFSPLSMLFLAEVMMLLFSILSFGFVPLLRKLMRVRRTLVLPLLTAGAINGVLAAVFWFTGLERTSAVNAQLFGMTEMLFLMVFGILFVHQPLKRSHGLGGAVITIGLLTVALRGFSEGLTFAAGDLCIILACLCYGVGGTIIRKYLRSIEPEVIIAVRSCSAVAFFFLISPFLSHPFIEEARQFPWLLLPVLLAYGFISRFLVVFSFYKAIGRLPIPTVSLLSTLVVAGGTTFAHLYLGEPLFWYHIAGAALIILGSTVVQWAGLHRIEEQFVHFVKSHHRQQM